jgi:hypothetical protein
MKLFRQIGIILAITTSQNILLGICCRSRKYVRKEKDGSEAYTTGERIYYAVIYIVTLLCFDLVCAMVVATLNADCELATQALTACMSDRPSDPVFPYNCTSSSEDIGPFNWINTRIYSIGNKSLSLKQRLNPSQYFIYEVNNISITSNLSDFSDPVATQNRYIANFQEWRDSFVCIGDEAEPDVRAYCLSPQFKCKVSSNIPTNFDKQSLTRFVVVKLVTIVITNIIFYILLQPFMIMLFVCFQGYCEPEKGTSSRTIYNCIVYLFAGICLFVMIFWIAVTLWLIFYYFTNISSSSRFQAILTTLLTWLFTITILDYIWGIISTIIFYPEISFCCKEPDEDSFSKKNWRQIR